MAKNDIEQMLTVSKYQFLNFIRSKRLYILLIITVIMALIFLMVIWYYIDPSKMNSNDFLGNWVTFVPFLTILIALFFGGDAIASEYDKKTGYFLFPNPIKRWTILWGKFMASLLASLIVLLLFWGFTLGDTYYYFGEITKEMWQSLGLSLLYLLSLLSLTYMFSSFFKSSAVAITIVAILYFFVFGIIESIGMFTGIEPWFSITYSSSVITNILKNPYPPHIQEISQGGLKITIFNPPVNTGIAIMLGYFIVSAIIATIVITYREMK